MTTLTTTTTITHIDTDTDDTDAIVLHAHAYPKRVEDAPGTIHEGVTLELRMPSHTFEPDGVFPRVFPWDRLKLTVEFPAADEVEHEPEDDPAAGVALVADGMPNLDAAHLHAVEAARHLVAAAADEGPWTLHPDGRLTVPPRPGEQRHVIWARFVEELERGGFRLRLEPTGEVTARGNG